MDGKGRNSISSRRDSMSKHMWGLKGGKLANVHHKTSEAYMRPLSRTNFILIITTTIIRILPLNQVSIRIPKKEKNP